MAQVTIDYSLGDSSPDGDVQLYQSTSSGSLGTQVQTNAPGDPTEFVVTGLAEATDYYWTVRRETDHVTADSTQVLQATAPAAASGVTVTDTDLAAATVDVSWTDNSSGESGYEIRVTEAGTERVVGDVGADTTSATTDPVDVTEATSVAVYAYYTDADGDRVYASGDSDTVAFGAPDNYWARYSPSDGSAQILASVLETGPTYEHTALHGISFDVRERDQDDNPVDLYATSDPFPELEVFLGTQRLLDATVVRREEAHTGGGVFVEALGPAWALTRSSPSSPVTYSDVTLEAAIRDYYVNHAPVDSSSVVAPSPTERQSAELVVDANGEFGLRDLIDGTVSDTDPIIVRAGIDELEQTQTAFTIDAQDCALSGAATTVASSGATDTTAVRLGATLGATVSVGGITLDHDIPLDEFEFWVRYEGGDTNVDVEVDIDGSPYFRGATGGSGDGYQWQKLENTEGMTGTLSGSFDWDLSVTGNVDSGDQFDVDVVAPLDTLARFGGYSYDFPDSLDVNGWLEGPEHYPTYTHEFDPYTGVWSIDEVDITSTWNDTSGDQQLAATLNGTDYLTADNTQTATLDFAPGTQAGVSVTPRVTFDGWEASGQRLDTPSLGYSFQAITGWELRVTGTDRATVDEVELSDTHWENILALHDLGDWRSVVDPTKRGIHIESFRTGDVVKSLDVRIRGDGDAWTREIDTRGFANTVTVTGRVPDGGDFATTATVQDAGSVAAVGEEPIDLLDLDAVTDAEVKNAARRELADRIARDTTTGRIDIVPAVVLPGYSYSNTPWGATAPLTRTEYREGRSGVTGRLDFTRDTDLTATTIETGIELRRTQDALNR